MGMIDKFLRCPNCHRAGEIFFDPDSVDIQQAMCRFCGRRLSVFGGIPDFAEHIDFTETKLGRAQKLMNSKIFASIYETLIWRRLHTRVGSGMSVEREVQEVLEMSGTDSAQVVADLACGTGHYARAFARKLPDALIYGLDISLSMLNQGRKKAQREGLTTITFLRGDIYQLPFENESVDWVNCSGTLHLFPNLAPIWREISRILRPSGVFTAMTITLVPGLIYKVQKRLMDRGHATFFCPHQLGNDLNAVGLSSFQYTQHRVSLIFRAVKT